ncbi:hypothetical protein [Paraliomyxa miuraensis]|uniref:hypothetical protein n=1 Tax=Paraliomyxa miuraensis TaxID=376150 RepID=UPI0022537CB1|nr:hypothetical protein [Paraliomyxa miuraensis]MCX4241560.1 hypothetical protein [Paraliomyxa miuraensis]
MTGTKRSGTSMWMQILTAAGLPAFGEAFPRNWDRTLKDANPDGFYESVLREGIYYRTNPHPQSGAFFHPSQVERHVVKVFIPGLVRTDLAYIGKVVATMRHWREYQRSLERLHRIEDEQRGPQAPPPERMPPWLEWWDECFMLMREILVRRHAIHVQSYDGLLADPTGVITRVVEWLALPDLDVAAAIGAVRPGNRTQHRPEVDGVPEHLARVFDELYASIDEHHGLPRSLMETLNATSRELAPQVAEHRKRMAMQQRARQGLPA